MQIDYHSDDKLIIKDDTKVISFIDLAKIHGYEIEGNPNHHWVLYQYKELIKDKKIEFGLGRSCYSPSGKIAELYFGYFINNINRRVIKLNEDGVVIDDYIILFDPSNIHNTYYYNASIPSPVKLEDYLSEEARYYDNSRKTQRISNGILKDNIVEEYLYYSNLYCNILNHYSDNYKVLKNIVQRIDDEWYLEDLQREIRYNELVRKK